MIAASDRGRDGVSEEGIGKFMVGYIDVTKEAGLEWGRNNSC